MPSMTRQSFSRLALASAVCGAGAAAAHANWFGFYSSPTLYYAKFTKVADFDQIRAGSAFPTAAATSVPTAGLDLLTYIAHHGYPDIWPANYPAYIWHFPWNQPAVTVFRDNLAAAMHTDGVTGTTGAGAMQGLEFRLDERFIVVLREIDIGQTPDFDDIASFVQMKAPVIGTVGWYSDDGVLLSRNGGHSFPVVKVSRSGNTRWLTMQDPADDADPDTQSPIVERTYTIEQRTRVVAGQSRTIDKLLGYGSGYLDSYIAIVPLWGLGRSMDLGDSITVVRPVRFAFDEGPITEPIPAPGVVTSLRMSPFSMRAWVTTAPDQQGTPAMLWDFDPFTGQFTPIAQMQDGNKAVFDRFGRYYLYDSGAILQINAFAEQLQVDGSVQPSGVVEALAADDVNDLVLALLSDNSVVMYDRDLNELPAVQLPDLNLEGARFLATSPIDGSMFLTSEGSTSVFHLVANGQRSFTVEVIGQDSLATPNGLSVGDRDCVFVTDSSGVVRVFCPDLNNGGWMEDQGHPAAGLAVGADYQSARSRSNFDPQIHTGPAYAGALPTEFAPADPGCAADLNDDNTVDGADLGLLLGAWGTEEFDLNGDGGIDGADLGLLLGAWGDCPS